MRLLVLASILVLASVRPTRAQSITLAPTISFGYGIIDGRHDHIGDEPTVLQVNCGPNPFPSEGGGGWSPPQCDDIPRAPFAPYGGVGATLVVELTSRFALASSLDVTLGSTHRIGETSRAGGARITYGQSVGEFPAMTYELAYRLAPTGRLLLGAARRGYVSLGARFGYRMQVGRIDTDELPRNPNPDADPPTWSHSTRGFTAESLLEGGVTIGDARSTQIGVVVGAGRPRLRAEVTVSFPFTIGGR